MFSEQQKKDLAAPLSASAVRDRNQGGRKVNYIEGWHAIAEANRIFGFDGWTRETVELKCVAEKERGIGKQQDPGFGVSYIAKVRIRVGEIVREGCGTGHGIDRDLGQAHESALKEAETDAMKRALMTFGNPFGLALYDKTQANVVDDEHDDKPKPRAESGTEYAPLQKPLLSEPQATKVQNELIENLTGCVTLDELEGYLKSDAAKTKYAQLPQKHRGHVGTAITNHKIKLQGKAA